jgi:hypothetical protein
MDAALMDLPADADDSPNALRTAALACLEEALRLGDTRTAAFPLLTADALLTHACEAAAESGAETLDVFCAALDLRRFAKLIGPA